MIKGPERNVGRMKGALQGANKGTLHTDFNVSMGSQEDLKCQHGQLKLRRYLYSVASSKPLSSFRMNYRIKKHIKKEQNYQQSKGTVVICSHKLTRVI